ncbi:hypothetical protein ACHAXT_008960 [Thalassiosira profunda]
MHLRNALSRPPPEALPRALPCGPLQWYISKLDTHPLTTKCLSSGFIAGSGDVFCQYLLHSKKTAREGDEIATKFEWDGIRTARFFTLGSAFVAPIIHQWYGFLMTRIPGTGVAAVAKRLVLDQGFFSPLFLPAWISCLAVLEHVSPERVSPEDADNSPSNNCKGDDFGAQLSARLRNDVPDILLVNWGVWIPSMAVMFAFVPSKFQVLYSNCIGFGWNAYLSWRTHEGEEGGDDVK